MRTSRKLATGALVVALGLGGAACEGDDATDDTVEDTEDTVEEIVEETADEADEVGEGTESPLPTDDVGDETEDAPG